MLLLVLPSFTTSAGELNKNVHVRLCETRAEKLHPVPFTTRTSTSSSSHIPFSTQTAAPAFIPATALALCRSAANLGTSPPGRYNTLEPFNSANPQFRPVWAAGAFPVGGVKGPDGAVIDNAFSR